MALAFTLLSDNPTTSGADTYTSDSVTPAASQWVVLMGMGSGVLSTTNPAPDAPTWLDGAWEGPVTVGDTSSEMNVWVGKVVASPAADTVSVLYTDPVSDPLTGHHLILLQATGGDAADITVQSKTASGTGTTGTVTLDSAMGSADNHHLAFISHEVNEAHAPGDGETELADNGYDGPTRHTSAQHKANDTSSAATWSTSADWIAVGIEFAVASSGTSETPTPGGALAAGNALLATVAVAIGGALGAGTAATAQTAVAQGGALAQGVSPVSLAAFAQGGATAQGTGPAPAVVAVSPGGGLAGGVAPADGAAVEETPTPGGAIAGGNAVTASTALTVSGAPAGGVEPTAQATAAIGGAIAAGTAPTSATATSIAGAVAAGMSPTARVDLSPGGAGAGGQLNDPNQIFVTGHFDAHTPTGGSDSGTPGAGFFDPPSPGQG